MKILYLIGVSLFLVINLSSCKKHATGAFFVSESGKVKIEVTGSQVPLDPWMVNLKVIVNNQPLYELSQIEVFASTIDSSTVDFIFRDGIYTVTIQQMDGSLYPIPIIKLPVK